MQVTGLTMFLIFTILKLTGTIDWSWWWISAPIWMPMVAVTVLWGTIFWRLFRGEIV